MKKILFVGLFLIGCATANAQENKGTLAPAKIFQRSYMVGGSISGSYREITNNLSSVPVSGNRAQIEADAKVGYFVLNDLAFGARLAVNHFRQKNGDEQADLKKTYILAGPFARYFLNNGFFGEGSYALGVNNTYGGVKSDISEARAGVGYALFINPKVAIEPAVHVHYFKEKQRDKGGENSYLSEFGPSLTLGLQIYLFRDTAKAFKL